jgi:hypothetical protein
LPKPVKIARTVKLCDIINITLVFLRRRIIVIAVILVTVILIITWPLVTLVIPSRFTASVFLSLVINNFLLALVLAATFLDMAWLLVALAIFSRFTASALSLVSIIGTIFLAATSPGVILVTLVISSWFTASVLVFLSLVSTSDIFLLALVLAAVFLAIRNLILILTVASQSVVGLLTFLKVSKLLIFIHVHFQLAVGVFIFPDIERIMSWLSLVCFLLVPRLLERSFKFSFHDSFTICDILVPSILLKLRLRSGVGGWMHLNT